MDGDTAPVGAGGATVTERAGGASRGREAPQAIDSVAGRVGHPSLIPAKALVPHMYVTVHTETRWGDSLMFALFS